MVNRWRLNDIHYNQLRRPFVTSCRVLNANPRTNAYFRAFVIGEHAVLKNWLIHLVIHTKANKCYSLILMVLCYSRITCHNYVLLWLVCRILYERPDSLFVSIFVELSINVHQIARKNWTEINCRIYIVQVCLKLAGACNETVYIPVRKHWSGRQSQWIEQNTIHFIEKYIFLLILTEDDRGRLEVLKKSPTAMQTPNCLHSAT